MQSRWKDGEAAEAFERWGAARGSEAAVLVYASRLLGADARLVDEERSEGVVGGVLRADHLDRHLDRDPGQALPAPLVDPGHATRLDQTHELVTSQLRRIRALGRPRATFVHLPLRTS